MADPEVQKRFYVLGTYTRDLTSEQTGEFMRSEEQLWWPIVRQVEAEDQKSTRNDLGGAPFRPFPPVEDGEP